MLGNTAFLEGVRVQVGTQHTDIQVVIRNNATIPGGTRDYFWAGQTRVFVELLPLLPSSTTFEAFPGFGGLEFTHKVWPAQVSEASAVSGAPRVTPGSTVLCLCHVTDAVLACEDLLLQTRMGSARRLMPLAGRSFWVSLACTWILMVCHMHAWILDCNQSQPYHDLLL
jgi:hypothetical protein